jgi:ABC-2 type transport system permease protein
VTTPLGPGTVVLLVARREFVAQIKSRSFVVGLVILLGLVGAGFLLVTYVGSQTPDTLGVTAGAAPLRPVLAATAAAQQTELEIRDVPADVGPAQVAAGELDAVLSGGPGEYRLAGDDAVDGRLQAVVAAAVRQQALDDALARAGVDPVEVEAAARLAVVPQRPAEPDQGQRLGLAIVGTVLLFVTFSGYGQLVATGVVEEKSSRVVELLLATIKPWQLLAGKIVGLGAVGLVQLVILSAIGAGAAAAAGVLPLPTVAAGMFAIVIVWYVLGYFLFAALYAAVAATVSRQEELNAVLAPMILVIVVPFVLTLNLLPGNPHNGLATALSFVPFFSQTVMPARYALGVAPLWQVAVSALLALGAVAVVVRAAGRIYRNSVLRTGARVPLREAWGHRH